jgi:hypothetical protein
MNIFKSTENKSHLVLPALDAILAKSKPTGIPLQTLQDMFKNFKMDLISLKNTPNEINNFYPLESNLSKAFLF